MIETKALLADLQRQVRLLEVDLRAQVEDVAEVRVRMRAEYDLAFRLGRTAADWPTWRDERVVQAAAAWALGTVFVRFCEDNGLLAGPYLTGIGDRLVLAEEAQDEFFKNNPAETDRGWLLAAFSEIADSQAGRLLFDERHNALFQIPVSHDAAKELIVFWRRRGADGKLVHDFHSETWDTRFLGDLYQDLSEAARKTYALLQTPEFVEEFILDYTLKPAIGEFGYDVVKVIDPTCGSGHFVLGAFHRLLKEWEKYGQDRDIRERVKLSLEAVHGVDLNPFAVAVARFRLFVAALKAAEFTTLAEARAYSIPLNLAIGDSLIKSRQFALPGMESDHVLQRISSQSGLFNDPNPQGDLFAVEPAEPVDELAEFAYFTEDVHEFPRLLEQGRYHVVVGNPPYITVKDKNLSRLYRELYRDVCSGQYALSVPFAQRFFQLAVPAKVDGRGSGYVGQITANSFMKREFGKKLIEKFFAHKVELTHIIDTSGAYIPHHGTPTVILIGRRKDRFRGETVRAVLGIRGESGIPPKPELGEVWQAIIRQIEHPGSESAWLSVDNLRSSQFSRYPWSLSGGGAGGLKSLIEADSTGKLEDIASMGVATTTGDDDAFLVPVTVANRFPELATYPMVEGDEVRDFAIDRATMAVWPYAKNYEVGSLSPELLRWFWPNRRSLQLRKRFSIPVEEIEGINWFEFRELYKGKLLRPLSLIFCTVATHNQFVFDRGGKAFNRHAPVVKLSVEASEEAHLELLGILNSSTACFWLKQVSQAKSGSGIGRGVQDEAWENRYEFTGTKLEEFPLPVRLPLERACELDSAARRLAEFAPAAVVDRIVPNYDSLAEARQEWQATRGHMIALQEELDWEAYGLYGLSEEDLNAPVPSVPELRLGERAFEIVLARKVARGEAETQWFARHGSTPITELPEHWPADYRAVVERRIELIETDRDIRLIERPEYKRRWSTEGWDAMQAKALRGWLLDRCEARELWFQDGEQGVQPRLLTTGQLADQLRPDEDFVAVAELYAPGRELGEVVADLVEGEHVPYLAALRYKDSGLVKRAGWEDVWDLQRAEDAAETAEDKAKIRASIPVPPKYTSADFRKPGFWRNRGKLDVPKERFISYPLASRTGDLLLGWAGFDHREQAQALSALIVDRQQNDGWDAERLTSLLAGLREVLPWVRQWHGEFDLVYAASPAQIYAAFLEETRDSLHLKDSDLTSWRPPSGRPGRAK